MEGAKLANIKRRNDIDYGNPPLSHKEVENLLQGCLGGCLRFYF